MRSPIEVIILSGDPGLTEAFRQALHNENGRFHCRMLEEAELLRLVPTEEEGVALLLPERWEQLAWWLPRLENAFPGYGWLLRCEQRLAGMFLSHLQRRSYVLLSPQSPLTDLINGLKALAYRQSKPLKPAEAFPTALTISMPGHTAAILTTRELEIGFALSLGLSNRQIAQALYVSEDTIKSHVHNLLHKLGLESRQEVADFINQMVE